MTDAEWKSIEPHLPKPCKLGRPRQVNLRAVVDATLCVAMIGCQWANLPKDFPAKSTAKATFTSGAMMGLGENINHHLVMQVRKAAGREASPTAGVMDSQSRRLSPAAPAAPVGLMRARRLRGASAIF